MPEPSALVVESVESDAGAPTMVLRYDGREMRIPFPMLVRMSENILAMRDAFMPAHGEPPLPKEGEAR